ncbi:MAG TPA: restriction endonuclease, partial [candidate division Zixibacteria bacterium]|nr:restriction endonuclease [candidate division Zixibacteria bacterium]
MYYVEIKHGGLKKLRIVRDRDPSICNQKAQLQLEKWEEIWQKKVEKENKLLDKESKLEEAAGRTKEAKEQFEELSSILSHTLTVDDKIDWEGIKDFAPFKKPDPKKPEYETVPPAPDRNDARFIPQFALLERIIPSWKARKITQADDYFAQELKYWQDTKERIEVDNKSKKDEYNRLVSEWKNKREAYLDRQGKNNDSIDARKNEYLKKLPASIVDYCELVLTNSQYPDNFPQNFDIDYKANSEILIVDYSLPSPELMLRLKEVRYIQSRDEFVESQHPEALMDKVYDSVVYQIALRTIHELFESDAINAIQSV